MEKLKQRYNTTLKTLLTLDKAIKLLNDPKNEEYYDSFRDSVVQRFEYSIDNFWKFLKIYLQEKHKIMTAASPKSVVRDAFVANIITEQDSSLLIECLRDRNLTSHTYNEPLAEAIVKRIPEYYTLMSKLLKSLNPS